MSFTFMCMKAEFTIKHLGRLELMVVDDLYHKTLLGGVHLMGLLSFL